MTEIRASAWTLALMGGAAGAALISALGLVQYRSAQAASVERAELGQRGDRLSVVSDYLSILRDVETGQRGFLVTENPDFLQPFDRSLGHQQEAEAKLKAFYPTNSAEQTIVLQLISTGHEKIARARSIVDEVQSGNRSRAIAEVRRGRGNRIMEQARVLASKLEDGETTRARRMLEVATDRRESEQSTIFALEALILAALLTMVVGLLRTVQGLRHRGSQLRDAALRQETIFEGASDAMLMLDALGNIESINAAAEHLFGYRRSETIGQSNLILFAEPPTRESSGTYLALLAAKDPRAEQKQIFAGLRGDGSTLKAEVVTTPIRLEDGQHYLAVARDVTERLEVERMKNEFVAIVSHELRTPLTSIAGSLGLLSGGAGGELPAKAKRLIEIAYGNSERLIRLINDMLDIEKIESGQVRLDLRTISLFPLLTDVAQANQAFAERQKVTVDVKHSPPEWAVIADRDRLIQVVTNLLSNAIKFSPERSTVTVSAEQIDGHFRINVRDHGPGIDQEFRERIFTKFAQADSTTSREKGGTGLGLSIVQELVRRMNGAVGFDSEAGKGSTFHVDLPAAAKAKSAMSSAGQTVHTRLSGDALPQILHVEDDPDMLRLVESAFEGRAHVLSTASVREAFAALERQFFDAVILDIAMPDGNGLDLVPRIRASAKHVPVILFTALEAAADERKDIEARLTKSKSSLGELVMTTERLLKKRG